MILAQSSRLVAVKEEETQLIGEEVATPPAPVREPRKMDAAFTALLWTSLKALSQRMTVALASLIDCGLIVTAFVMWLMVIANPTDRQLFAVGGYALFILACLYIRNRRS